MVDPIDTKPKAPSGLHERLTAEEPPRTSSADTAEFVPLRPRPRARPLLLMIVLLGPLCV
jgi:hypothetical protein